MADSDCADADADADPSLPVGTETEATAAAATTEAAGVAAKSKKRKKSKRKLSNPAVASSSAVVDDPAASLAVAPPPVLSAPGDDTHSDDGEGSGSGGGESGPAQTPAKKRRKKHNNRKRRAKGDFSDSSNADGTPQAMDATGGEGGCSSDYGEDEEASRVVPPQDSSVPTYVAVLPLNRSGLLYGLLCGCPGFTRVHGFFGFFCSFQTAEVYSVNFTVKQIDAASCRVVFTEHGFSLSFRCADVRRAVLWCFFYVLSHLVCLFVCFWQNVWLASVGLTPESVISHDFPVFAPIVPETSKFFVFKTKVELKLHKVS
jgi:hypothetical protein